MWHATNQGGIFDNQDNSILGKTTDVGKGLADGLKAAKTKRCYFALVLKGGTDSAPIVSKSTIAVPAIAEVNDVPRACVRIARARNAKCLLFSSVSHDSWLDSCCR